MDLSTLQGLNFYLDAGNEDEFQFNIHTDNFVKVLEDRGLKVQIENGFPDSFPRVSHFDQKRAYVKYEGGHVGFNKENIGKSFRQSKKGVEGAIVVANRFTTLFAFVSDHFPSGEYGTDPYEMFRYPSKMRVGSFYSPSLNWRVQYVGFGPCQHVCSGSPGYVDPDPRNSKDDHCHPGRDEFQESKGTFLRQPDR